MKLAPVFKRKAPKQWTALLLECPWIVDEGPPSLDRLADCAEVHKKLKLNFKYTPDRNDKWAPLRNVYNRLTSRWSALGDCDDFAVTAMMSLRKRLYAMKDLRLVVCTVPDGLKHMVLAVEDGERTIIIDSLASTALYVDDPFFKQYRWHMASVPGQRNRWSSVVKGK